MTAVGSPHDHRQPAYRPLPTPPRMRWAVEPGHRWSYAYLAWAAVGAASCVAVCAVAGAPWWLYLVGAVALSPLVVAARMRLVRVPVEPPRVRVAETDTLEEHRDLTDAGYVYDHEARVYRLDAHEGGWGPQSNGVHGYTRWDKGELP